MQILSSLSGLQFSAASAGYAPTNSADVSAIASAYQVVSATATQLYAGTSYLTSVNGDPVSASRAGNAANASLANSAWYDGTGRLISALPDSAAVSAIASSYAESAASSKLDESATADFYSTSNPSGFVDSSYVDSSVSGKQDTLTFGYDGANISSIDGSALAGGGGGGIDSATCSAIASSYAESAVSSYVPYSGLEYNTASAISGINGSALAAGSTYSAGEGIDITDDVISVETPVDIVAGPGIVIDNPDGNTLRVSTEADAETVLYEKTWAAAGGNAVLSESADNFQQLRITFNIEASAEAYCPVVTAIIDIEAMLASTTNRLFELTCVFSRSDGGGRYIITRSALMQNDGSTLTVKTVDQSLNFSTSISSMNTSACRILKVVGIHRIANN